MRNFQVITIFLAMPFIFLIHLSAWARPQDHTTIITIPIPILGPVPMTEIPQTDGATPPATSEVPKTEIPKTEVPKAEQTLQNEEQIQNDYEILRSKITANSLTYFQLSSALRALLWQLIDNSRGERDDDDKIKRIRALLKTVDKFLSNLNLFTDKSETSQNARNKFFTELQLALRYKPEVLMQTKALLVKALRGTDYMDKQ